MRQKKGDMSDPFFYPFKLSDRGTSKPIEQKT